MYDDCWMHKNMHYGSEEDMWPTENQCASFGRLGMCLDEVFFGGALKYFALNFKLKYEIPSKNTPSKHTHP